jgi:hypothetical protein
MHVLHRPHIPKVITVTMVAGLLAIVLTLAIASAVSDHAPSTATAYNPPVAAQATPASSEPRTSAFTRSPIAPLLTSPITPPWVRQAR